MKNAIVLLIDGLGAPWIGPYGNTIIETPAFNRLAARSFLAEHVLIESPCLSRIYDSLLKGGHASFDASYFTARPPITQILRNQGVSTTVVVDELNADRLPITNTFDSKVVISLPFASRPVDEFDETWLAGFFAEVVSSVRGLSQPFLCWIHCPGLYAPWDAPYELRCSLVDDEDPAPPTLVKPPSFATQFDLDPDQQHGLTCAYGGQVILLDSLLDIFLDAIEPLLQHTLLIVSGIRGYPLGVHRVVGDAACPLYSELTHVPLLVRFPAEQIDGFRSQSLFQGGDLHATLAAWLGAADSASPLNVDLARVNEHPGLSFRQIAVCQAERETAIRTSYWYARTRLSADPQDESTFCELFAKPDDRWDANDVADRCPDICHDVAHVLNQLSQLDAKYDLSSINVPASLLVPPD
jgi:arylsulfatase A-like enzyme